MTLIAFGMGLPDTFASRHAAMHEKDADAAIGHLAASTAVNVFLGIGMAWTVAASVQTYKGRQYKVYFTRHPFPPLSHSIRIDWFFLPNL